jgi:ubiquitin C-terminal hydrolase
VQYTSSTYDPFLDLSLEISRASTLQHALQHFTAGEILDGDNRCGNGGGDGGGGGGRLGVSAAAH